MTILEFSDGFDVLYNNVMSNQAPGLDEYEKSFFLTKAQDEILKNYFNPKGNKYQEGVDGSAKRQIDFSMVLKTGKAEFIEDSNVVDFGTILGNNKIAYTKLDPDSSVFRLPSDVFIVLNERIIYNNTRRILVQAINNEDYDRYSMKPYPFPAKNISWRLLGYGLEKLEGEEVKVFIGEIISSKDKNFTSNNVDYTIRYVKKPNPIVLGPLGSTSIDGISDISECELDPILHQEILQRAVELAKAAYVGDINSITEMGKRSE